MTLSLGPTARPATPRIGGNRGLFVLVTVILMVLLSVASSS